MTKMAFIPVMFQDETIAEIAKDGLIYKFEQEIIEQKLNLKYEKDKDGWFFNKSKDRYCAEKVRNSILVNPSAVSSIFGHPVLFEN